MTDRFLEVTDLHKSYEKGATTVDVLRGATFAVARSDMVSVIGRAPTPSLLYLNRQHGQEIEVEIAALELPELWLLLDL